jgi:hypothetical protein
VYRLITNHPGLPDPSCFRALNKVEKAMALKHLLYSINSQIKLSMQQFNSTYAFKIVNPSLIS